VIDLDIQAFFDTLDHALVLKAVRHHTDLRWIPLYVERWLVAPVQAEDGTVEERKQGSPQGAPVSPLLANLYLHWAFDAWMQRAFPQVRFERYCDDIVVHCHSQQQAQELLARISQRLADCGLRVNQEKTRIVYCQDDRRGGHHDHAQFDFLGYTFRARPCKDRQRGGSFLGFNPAISDQAQRRISREIRAWHLQRWSSRSLNDLAEHINPVVRGWHIYYGRYFPSALSPLLARLNEYLVRWAQRKYKRLAHHSRRAWQFLANVATREPRLFVHWTVGQRPRAG
jgi:RNA-directed DNA polymerase